MSHSQSRIGRTLFLICLTAPLTGCVESLSVTFEPLFGPDGQDAAQAPPCVDWPFLSAEARKWLNAHPEPSGGLAEYFLDLERLQQQHPPCPVP